MPLAVTDPALTHDLGPIQLVFVTLVAAIGLTYLARRLRIADPILLLLGGIVLGQLPDLPDIVLAPDIVFLLFLPPILFGAAYFTPIRDFRANLRPILLLAIGLVLFTTVVVAFVAAAASRACRSLRRSHSGPSSRHRTPSPPRRSSGALGSRAGS